MRVAAQFGNQVVEFSGVYFWNDTHVRVHRFMVRNSDTGKLEHGVECESGARAFRIACVCAKNTVKANQF